MNGTHSHDLLLFLLQLSVMLTVALTFGQLIRRLHQPTVLGELIGGILIGPTVLGSFAPRLHSWLFPLDSGIIQPREAVIRIGMLFFLFVAGLEINLTHLRRKRWSVLCISLFGCLLPFSLGSGSVFLFPNLWGQSEQASLLTTALFIGTALSISALPVISRILIDLRLLQHELGVVILSAATINDLIGWSLFAVLLNGLNGHPLGSRLGMTLAGVLIVSVLIVTLGRWFGRPVLRWVRRSFVWPSGFLGAIIVLILVAGAFAEALGIHAIFGAFLVGVALHHVFEQQEEHAAREIIRQFALSFFAPLYFVSVGLKANFATQFDLSLVLLVILLATIGKVGGASIGAWMSKVPRRDGLAIGFGLNARGAMEIILASVALDFKLIDQRVFVALVTMALITTLLSGPVLESLVQPDRSSA